MNLIEADKKKNGSQRLSMPTQSISEELFLDEKVTNFPSPPLGKESQSDVSAIAGV
jgi:hypothetical protein